MVLMHVKAPWVSSIIRFQLRWAPPCMGPYSRKALTLGLYLPLQEGSLFVGPCPHKVRYYRIGSNFWKFYLIRTSFTLGEPVSLVKVFRLFRLELFRLFWCSECGHNR
jgi:hypothetical protein